MPTEGSILATAQTYSIREIITQGIAYAILAAGILSVIFIFIGGFSFILSGGDEEKIKKAVGTIRYAILGLVVSILAVVIVGIVGRFIGVDIIRYINFNEVIQNIQSLSQGLSSSPTSGGNSLGG